LQAASTVNAVRSGYRFARIEFFLSAFDRVPRACLCGDQGTLTGGIGRVSWGTKRDSCGRAMTENVIRVVIRITSPRMFRPPLLTSAKRSNSWTSFNAFPATAIPRRLLPSNQRTGRAAVAHFDPNPAPRLHPASSFRIAAELKLPDATSHEPFGRPVVE
jgi:hypothetical protein